ncbi:esterase [Terrilactibacillus sp. S3-3]|nr:esterase [Terrilactibacillus sp. S3-3]
MQGFGKPHREVFDEGVGRLTSFIDYACESYPIDPKRLYLAGFSQGAILAMTLGLSLGKRIRGIAALSGYIPDFVRDTYDIKPVAHLSAFISHGDMDNILPYEWGRANVKFFKELGASVTFHTYHAGHTVSSKNLQDFQQWLWDDLNESSAASK